MTLEVGFALSLVVARGSAKLFAAPMPELVQWSWSLIWRPLPQSVPPAREPPTVDSDGGGHECHAGRYHQVDGAGSQTGVRWYRCAGQTTLARE